MSYRVIKRIKGIPYLYEQSGKRINGKVVTTCKCIGKATPDEILKYSKKVNTTKYERLLAKQRGLKVEVQKELYKYGQQLLKESKEKNNGWEVAGLLCAETGKEMIPMVHGEKERVSVEETLQYIKNHSGNYVNIHNHPDTVMFSKEDIKVLSKFQKYGLQRMYVVCSNNKIEYFITASKPIDEFVHNRYNEYFCDVISKISSFDLRNEESNLIYNAHMGKTLLDTQEQYKEAMNFSIHWDESFLIEQKKIAKTFYARLARNGASDSDIQFFENLINGLFENVQERRPDTKIN